MFDFFEKITEGIGFRLIGDFSEKVCDWIKEVRLKAKKNDNQGNSPQVVMSKDYSEVTTSRWDSQIVTSGHDSKVATSGHNSQIATSGDCSQVAISGDNSKLATSGDCSQVATSGNYSKVAILGYDSQVAISGDNSQVATSGDCSKVATSGYCSKLVTSGNYSKVATSGHNSQIATSGNYSKVATSGNYSKVEILGDNSIGFLCGLKSIIKAKKGTWISLAEYKKDSNNNTVPIFVKTAQIGNEDYKDFFGKILNDKTYYILWKKEFYPVQEYDGISTIILSEKVRGKIKIIKAIDINVILEENPKYVYIVTENNLSAHGYTVKEAMEDLTFKKLGNINKKTIVKQIKETGKVTRSQYRALTGACSFGTNKFCVEHNIENLEEIELDKLRKILINDYGAEEFWSLIDKEV